jgi:hypothetical protein
MGPPSATAPRKEATDEAASFCRRPRAPPALPVVIPIRSEPVPPQRADTDVRRARHVSWRASSPKHNPGDPTPKFEGLIEEGVYSLVPEVRYAWHL